MGVAHGHGDGGVAEYLLQHQNVAAVHHKMAGEGVAQNVGILPRGQLQPCPFDHHLEGAVAVTKQAAALSRQLGIQLGADGHAAALLALGAGEGNAIGDTWDWVSSSTSDQRAPVARHSFTTNNRSGFGLSVQAASRRLSSSG